MAQKDDDLSVTLPEELRRQFADVQGRLWRVETTVALGSIIAGLIISLLALFVSDRLWNTPPALRLVFSLLGLAAVIAAFYHWAQRWLWHRRSLQDLANLVQKKYRRLGDRLLGIVELAQEQRHLANFSPALYHAAIHQVADEARQYDFRQSVSARPAKKFALGAGTAAACWLVLSLALPQASWNAFLRWAAPTANIPRYTLVGLDGLPRELIVPHGEPFAISGNVQYRSFWKPGRVSGQLLTLPRLEGVVDSGKIHLQIPGQVENGLLRVQVGDAMAEVRIVPVHRPSLRELSAQIQLPDYLKYPDQNQVLQSGSLLAVEGSHIAFHGKTSRALSSAQMQAEGGEPAPLKIEGENFASAPAQPDGIAEYTFNCRDDLGLSNAAPLRLSVAMQKDAPPVPELPGMPRETAMLVSDVLHIRTEASDDFGVLDLGLTWDLASDSPLTEGYTSEIKIMPPSSHVKKAAKVFLWSPQVFRIPADSTVELQGFARDFLPERERSRTAFHRIRVLSPEEHAELVREELEAVMARIEEVTRLQEKIAANLRDVKDSEKLPESQKSERVGQSKNDQLANSAHLDELNQQAQRAVQEAMKNPLFPPDTIRKWSQSAQQWQQLAQEKMKDAAASMQSAQQSSPSRPQQMADATQKAEDILKALEKMQDKASQHMDQLQALTLAKRLRKVGEQEKEIGAQLLKTAPDTIGLPPGDLPEKFKQFDQALTGDQGRARKESDTLQGEISRFYERTQKTNYGAVSQEMKDSRATDELERVGGLIGDNISIEASGNLGQWSERFQKWGDKLEPKPDDSGGGQGSSGKSQSKDLTEQLIALLRLRESEMTLRDQTTVLDQQKGDPASFKDRANSLSDTQKKLAGDLAQIDQKVAIPEMEPAFAQTAGVMEKVETVLQMPQTGKPADEAEVKTIDSLSDLVNLINEQAQHGKPQPSPGEGSSSAEEMAFLMRMMQNSADAKAMALQPATGLNHAGGKTDRAGNPVTGNASGKGAATRNVDKASGVIENSPTEFRDALDIYFHGIEQSKN
jgi:hypothetical protein